MNLHRLLKERQARAEPLRVGLIGAGKFGVMFLAQARHTPGIHVVAIADLEVARAKEALHRTGWPAERTSAKTPAEARERGTTHVGEDAAALIEAPGVDIVIDATGSPRAGIGHALAATANGKHVVMVNVEADALAGAARATRARGRAGVLARLRGSAGAHLRGGRLGARRGFRGGRGRQGH